MSFFFLVSAVYAHTTIVWKKWDYPYTFPLLGKKAYKKGFDIPYAWGISPVYFAQRQDIEIAEIAVGLNDGSLADISGIVGFGRIENKVSTFTIRPDLWVLPFLNIYGIFGFGKTSTEVPLVKPIDFTTVQNFDATSAGLGFTFAGGIGPVIVIIDNNFNWANVEAFVEPVPAITSTPASGTILLMHAGPTAVSPSGSVDFIKK